MYCFGILHRFFVIFVVLFLLPTPKAEAASVLFVTDEAGTRPGLATALQQGFTRSSAIAELQQQDLQVFIVTTEPNASGPPDVKQHADPSLSFSGQADITELCDGIDIVVAAGKDAAQVVRQQCRKPTLLLFIPRFQADELLAQAAGEPITAVYLEADPVSNFQLMRSVLEPSAHIGVLLSEKTVAWLPQLRSAATAMGFSLETIIANQDGEAARVLRQRITTLDAILLVPDYTLINAWSLKPILLMTARSFLPVFGGPTDNYVKAGVTAARVPDFDGLIEDIKTVIKQLAAGETPPPRYPSTLRTEINEWVARGLSIDIQRLRNSHEP